MTDPVSYATSLPNDKLRAAREEAWGGKNLGSIRVLLSNPRWKSRFLKFLELSGVGRVAEGGTDGPDGWIVWEAEERAAQ
jgi:hypothetical protein